MNGGTEMDVREKLVELLKEIVAIQECGFGDPRPTYETVARYLISRGVTVQEWIPAKDRLPDWRDGKVLVFTKYGFSICERTVNNRWRGQHANWITHWAYLPQPPK